MAASSVPAASTITNLFHTTFTNGDVSEWRLPQTPTTPNEGWRAVRQADGQWVLEGKGHTWASLVARHDWRDVILRVRVRILRGGLHLNYRISNRARYFIGLGAGGIGVSKQYFPNTFPPPLGQSSIPNATNLWHWVQIAGRGGFISVMVDGAQRLLVVDPKPILSGSIAFEALDEAWVQIAEVSVVGPPSEQAPVSDPSLVWVRTGGPLGGIGYDVRIDPTDPQVLYVTDAFSGVSKSTNGGAWWFPANEGIISRTGASGDSIPVFCLTIDPHNPKVLWCGTQGMRGIYRSTNAAATWIKSDQGIPELEGITFRSFTVDPLNAELVYAGTEIPTSLPSPDIGTKVRGKIYKTNDGGRNWKEILDCGALVRWMAIDPTDTRVLYAATGIFDRDCVQREGVLKSSDGGGTWRHINGGLPNLNVGGLMMDPRDHRVLYAATGQHDGFGGGQRAGHGGVYKTLDGGEHWQELLQLGEGFPITAIALAPSAPDLVYAAFGHGGRFFRSRDAGKTWKETPMAPDGAYTGIPIALSVGPVDCGTVFLNSYVGGVFSTLDGGETWHISSRGYTGAQMVHVAVAPDDPRCVYAGGRLGLTKSTDGGDSWTYLAAAMVGAGVAGAPVISVNPLEARDLVVGGGLGQIARSRDGGKTWHQVHTDTLHPNRAFHSHDVVGLARCAMNPTRIYAAARPVTDRADTSLGVLRSSDGGEHWQPVNAGLIRDLSVNCVAVHPTNPDLAYAGTLNGAVFQTTDGGEHWRPAGNAFAKNIRSLAIHPSNARVLLAGTEMDGLFVSHDAGRIWEPAGAGLDPNASIQSIVFDPSAPNVIWVADIHTGVYRSVDGGKRWVAASRGLRTRAVKALASSADGHVLYAATDGEGVFRLEIKTVGAAGK